MRSPFRTTLAAAVAIVAAGGLAGCTKDATSSSTTVPATSTTSAAPSSTVAQPTTGQVTSKDGITRTILGVVDPPNAKGQTLYLQRVEIDPGAQLVEHFHDGAQVARVESGTLTYNIVSGDAPVVRADGSKETFTGPTVVTLAPGDTVTETAQLVHFGANKGTEKVVIVASTLLKSGAGLATPTQQK